jgi:hypothetical protein
VGLKLDQQPDRNGAARAVLVVGAVVVDLGDAAIGAGAEEKIVAAERDGAAAVARGGAVGGEFEQSRLRRDDEGVLVAGSRGVAAPSMQSRLRREAMHSPTTRAMIPSGGCG